MLWGTGRRVLRRGTVWNKRASSGEKGSVMHNRRVPLGRGEVRVFPEEGPSVAWGAGIGCCDGRGQYCLWELEMLQVVGSQPSWVGGI